MTKQGKIIRILLIGMTVIIAIAFIVDTFTYRPDIPDFYTLDVSASEIKTVYEELGYTFLDAGDLLGQPLQAGFSPYRFLVIQLIGSEDNLVSIRIASVLTTDMTKTQLNQIRSEIELMFELVTPSWNNAESWFKEKTLDIGNNGTRNTTFEDIEIIITVRSSNMTFGLSFGEWKGIPDLDRDDMLWLYKEW